MRTYAVPITLYVIADDKEDAETFVVKMKSGTLAESEALDRISDLDITGEILPVLGDGEEVQTQ